MTTINEPQAPASSDELVANLVARLIPNHTFVEAQPETIIEAEQLFAWCRGRTEAWLKRNAVKASSGYTFSDARRTTFQWAANEAMMHLLYRQLLPGNNERYLARSLASRILQAKDATKVTVANPQSPLFASAPKKERGSDGHEVAVFDKAMGSWGNKDNAVLTALTGEFVSEDAVISQTQRFMREAFPELTDRHPAKLKVKHKQWRETAWDVLDRAAPPLLGGEDMFLDEDQRSVLFEATLNAVIEEIGQDIMESPAEHIPDALIRGYQHHEWRQYLREADEEIIQRYCAEGDVQYDIADREGTITRLLPTFQDTTAEYDRVKLVLPQSGSECKLYTDVLTNGVLPILKGPMDEEKRDVVRRMLPIVAYYAVIIASEIKFARKEHMEKLDTAHRSAEIGEQPIRAIAAPDPAKIQRYEETRDALQAFMKVLYAIRSVEGFDPKSYPIFVLLKFLEASTTRFTQSEYMDLRMSL